MKRIRLIMMAAALLCAACTGKESVSEPDLTVFLDAGEVFADEAVSFRMEGHADIISFWSGEEGNDYAWREEDRLYEGEGKMSFSTAFMNGQQWKNQASSDPDVRLVTLWWSDDFGGNYTPEGVAQAHWHDISPLFAYATARVDDARDLSVATPSGGVNLRDFLPAGKKGPFWFAFRYHLHPIVNPDTDSRSRAVISGFAINLVNEALRVNEPIVTHASAGWTFVNIGFNEQDAGDNDSHTVYLPESTTSYLYFNASTYNTAERWSWAVSQAWTPSYTINLGCDYSLGIKSFSESPMRSYTYTYTAPGDYDAVFESRNVSPDGQVVTKTQHLTVHVSSRGGAQIDTPDPKVW